MCRWFAYISPSEECLLEDVLITPKHGLAKQVHDHYLPKLFSHTPGEETTGEEVTLRNRLFNVDGFGMAWYTPTRSDFVSSTAGIRPAVYKNSQPPTNDANFHSICGNTSTTAVFAHIRAATGTSVATINNHPFTFGRHTIMHNGLISDFADVRRVMLPLLAKPEYENIQGTTDSEHLAALYMTNLTRSSASGWEQTYSPSEMLAALVSAFKSIIALQQDILGPENVKACSLNVCCTDGQKLLAVRLRNHATEQPPSLYYSTKAGITLNRKYPDSAGGEQNPNASKKAAEHGKHVIVASEPTTYKAGEWALIEKNHALLVDAQGNMTIESVELPQELMAQAATGKHF
ncbi:hypothetical protein RBB50_002509 [Rhinocladiella similis]